MSGPEVALLDEPALTLFCMVAAAGRSRQPNAPVGALVSAYAIAEVLYRTNQARNIY